jgi:WD40 repeat protein
MMTSSSFVYDQLYFSGHRKAISCVKIKEYVSKCEELNSVKSKLLVFTGSEDSTVRIWDSSSQKPIKCFTQCFKGLEVDLLEFHPTNSAVLFVVCGNQLFAINFQLSSAVIERSVLDTFNDHSGIISGDINSLAIHGEKLQMAISDDSCMIYLIPFCHEGLFLPPAAAASSTSSSFYPSLRRIHTNIIYSLLFTNNTRKEELFSGGFDFCLCLWDLDGRNRLNRSVTISANEEFKDDNQTLNPPFIYCLQLMFNNRLLVVALGDGFVSALIAFFLYLS